MPARNKKPTFKEVVKWIIFATNVVAIILLFSSFLSWNISPLKTNLFSYIGLGFGIIFFLNAGYLAFWIIFSKWKLAFVSLAAIMLCHKPVTTFFPLNIKSPKVPENTIKVLTYNVQGFPEERNKNTTDHPILDYISSTDAT